MMQCQRKLKVTDLNPHLICVLCGGYYVDATTIIECLHSFCRSCIVRYLETNKYCPICDVQVHKTRPLQNIRPDNTLQTIVYKLVPGLYQNEMRYRRDFYAKHPEVKAQAPTPEARGELTDQSRIFLPDEPISLCLEYSGDLNSQTDQHGTWGRRYLRCPAAVSVSHLHKLIRAKFGLAMGHRVDVFYKEEFLPDNWTLMDIAYIYQWKRKSPIHLSYQILESQRKRIKLSHDSHSALDSSSLMDTSTPECENDSNKCLENSKPSSDIAASTVSNKPGETPTSSVTVPAGNTEISQLAGVATITTTTSAATSAATTTTTAAATTTTALSKTDFTVSASSNKENSVEWKEVQLQISENGIMSVAGVENDRLLTPLQTISVSSQNDSADSIVNTISIDSKSDAVIEKPPDKVPPVDSDSNSSALRDNVVKCESRTKPAEAPTNKVDTRVINNAEIFKGDIVKDTEIKTITKDNMNHVDGLKQCTKPLAGYKLPNNSDKTNAIFKSKTDKLEDAVRNIANRTEPNAKPDSNLRPAHVSAQLTQVKESSRPKVYNSEPPDGLSGNSVRPLTSTPKVYPGVKPSVYNAIPKEELAKMNNNKMDPVGVSGAKPTPMEILNSQSKLQNHMVKYKSSKTSSKQWNPSISRAAVLAMKHPQLQSQSSGTNKETNATDNQQLNPPPVKQPRFFKIRNMPRFLGNPASGVKPMYQVAPGSEIVAGNGPPATVSVTSSAVTMPSSAVAAQNSVTTVSSAAVTGCDVNIITSNCSVASAVISAAPVVTTSTSIGVSSAAQKILKSNSGPGMTLMKIDPKTLSPIPVNSVTVSHVLNNPPRNTSSPQPKKLPPPFTPGSPKHSNHYTNCRTTDSNSKSSVPRTPSPAHTAGLIPTHPFIPVSHANPHLLYGAFPNPFSPTGSRLLPPNSELIRAMSALCSSGSAFHPSLPPSISMLFNPHHAHHRTLPPERSNFKCSSGDKKATQSPPPTVQRVPPSNPSNKGYNETDSSQQVNHSISSCSVDQLSNSVRLKKSKTEHSTPSVKNTSSPPKQSQSPPTSSLVSVSPPPKKSLPEPANQQVQSQQSSSKLTTGVKAVLPVANQSPPETKTVPSGTPKLKPGEKIKEVTSELLLQSQMIIENKCNNNNDKSLMTKPVSDSSAVDHNVDNSNSDKNKTGSDKHNKTALNNNNEIPKVYETKSKDEQLNNINNNNNVNKVNKTSNVSNNENKSVDNSSVLNNKNA